MPEILHVSDLHFGPPFQPDRAAGIQAMTRRLRPDLLVVSGDFTQRAKVEQYRAARDFLDAVPVPVAVTPGNHDLPLYRILERLVAPYRNYRAHISRELDSVHRLEGMTVVCLNSTRPYYVSNGRLSRRQLAFAAEVFADTAPEELRVVVTHHHLAPPPDFERGEVMPKAKRAIEAFTRMRVDLILAGHMHRSYIGDSLDFFPGGDREKGIVVVQCGTTTSARGRGRERLKNSLNVIRTRPGQVRITHFLWRESAEAFWPHSEHRFGTRESVWLAPREGDGTATLEVRP